MQSALLPNDNLLNSLTCSCTALHIYYKYVERKLMYCVSSRIHKLFKRSMRYYLVHVCKLALYSAVQYKLMPNDFLQNSINAINACQTPPLNNKDINTIGKDTLLEDGQKKIEGNTSLYLEDGVCYICLESYQKLLLLNIKIIELACGHKFCQECIESWQRKSQKCPLCRITLDKENVRNHTNT